MQSKVNSKAAMVQGNSRYATNVMVLDSVVKLFLEQIIRVDLVHVVGGESVLEYYRF